MSIEPGTRAHAILTACHEAACLPETDAAEPHGYAASNPLASLKLDTIKSALSTLDAKLQQFAPVIEGFTPAQYRVYEETVLALIHTLNNGVNPAPV